MTPAPLRWFDVGVCLKLTVRADFRTPAVEAPLDLTQHAHGRHAGESEDQNADEDLIGLKSRAGDGDHETDARGCRIQLADHDADEGAADAKAKAGEDKREGDRKSHGSENLPLGR